MYTSNCNYVKIHNNYLNPTKKNSVAISLQQGLAALGIGKPVRVDSLPWWLQSQWIQMTTAVRGRMQAPQIRSPLSHSIQWHRPRASQQAARARRGHECRPRQAAVAGGPPPRVAGGPRVQCKAVARTAAQRARSSNAMAIAAEPCASRNSTATRKCAKIVGTT